MRPITRRPRPAVVSAFLTGKARIDRQVAYPATKQKARAAVAAVWSGHEGQ